MPSATETHKFDLEKAVTELKKLGADLYHKDFLLTWQKNDAEIHSVLRIAEILKEMHARNISARMFETGLAVSNFRDNSTRTRFSFASACNLLGLAVQDLDEGKSQIAHGETVRETANMISFLTEVVGIRDDMFIGKGHTYMKEVAEALDDGHRQGVLNQRPAVVNLQCDLDHPTQSMSDLLFIKNHFGGFDKLKGKKIAMTWAYSPSYGKPLSVPQGVIGLASRFGMEIALAYPEGYDLIPEVVQLSRDQAEASGGMLTVGNSMDSAFAGADIVYPKSWAPYDVMQKRVPLLHAGDQTGLKELEKSCLANNAKFKDWECTEEKMKLTKDGKALYMHCLPADITDVSCKAGEVAASVFDRYRDDTYREASYKPYIIAAMILLGKFKDPAALLKTAMERGTSRSLGL
ncbi:MAG TPA: knotted carbamoyltransferase YgeW [Elusimicrobia bacterium]|nr:knotted carbamoyltransferase YgeW [Elusimicrobiota bacterium]